MNNISIDKILIITKLIEYNVKLHIDISFQCINLYISFQIYQIIITLKKNNNQIIFNYFKNIISISLFLKVSNSFNICKSYNFIISKHIYY